MQSCPYCVRLQPDWNLLYDEFSNRTDVKFLLVEGPKVRKLGKKYHVNGFPTVIFVKGGSRGAIANEFDEEIRNFTTLKNWLNTNIEHTHPHE